MPDSSRRWSHTIAGLLGHALARIGRFLYDGLIYSGLPYIYIVPNLLAVQETDGDPPPDRCLPPGHPERLRYDLRPSPAERRLWKELEADVGDAGLPR